MRLLPRLLFIALVLGSANSRVEAAAATAAAKAAPPAAKSTRPAAKAAAKSPKPAAGSASGASTTRTLDAVHIEGELDVPEVLFITARDQRRIVGFQHRRYLPGSAELAKSTPLPSHVVVGRKPVPVREDNSR